MPQVLTCEACSASSVEKIGEGPRGVSHWACTACGDAKRWCPRCDQGWIRRLRVRGIDNDLYSCGECDATWTDVRDMSPPGADLETLLSACLQTWTYKDVFTIRETRGDQGAV
jgi:transposase-like protein